MQLYANVNCFIKIILVLGKNNKEIINNNKSIIINNNKLRLNIIIIFLKYQLFLFLKV